MATYAAPMQRTSSLAVLAASSLLVAGLAADDAAATAPDPPFPAEIEHKFGTTVVADRPERVVSIGYNEHDVVLAFGIEPVAVRYWYGAEDDVTQVWTDDLLSDGEPEVLNMPELNFEAIAALEPDLIVGTYSGIDQGDYDRLAAIAPTVAQSGEHVDYGMPWQEVTRTIGAALGEPDRAEEMIAELEGRFAAARDAHPEWDGRSLVVAVYGDGSELGFFASPDPRSRFFTQLGFATDPQLDEIAGDQFYGSLSPERVAALDQDLIVWDQISFTEGGRATLEADPLVATLDAMRDGRTIVLEDDVELAFGWNTILSIPYALDAIVPMLEDAVAPGE